MKSFSYRAFIDKKNDSFNLCSRELTDVNMFVNCTGLMCLDNRFTTINEKGREDYYLMYIIRGTLELELGGRVVTGRSGDFVIYPPRAKYKYAHKEEDDNVAYYFVHFTGSYVKMLLETLGLGTEGGIWHAGTSESVSRTFSELFTAFNSDERYKWERCGIITELILTMLAERRSRGERSILYKSLSYINSFYTDKISIPELAKMENISVSRYNTLFRKTTGTSPTKYIMGLRINHAITLLSSTDMDIGQIGELVGYSDKHFFSRAFKSYTGKTPREYRDKANSI